MDVVRQPTQPATDHSDLIERIIEKLRAALNEDLPRGGDGGLTVTINIAPVRKDDFNLSLTRKYC